MSTKTRRRPPALDFPRQVLAERAQGGDPRALAEALTEAAQAVRNGRPVPPPFREFVADALAAIGEAAARLPDQREPTDQERATGRQPRPDKAHRERFGRACCTAFGLTLPSRKEVPVYPRSRGDLLHLTAGAEVLALERLLLLGAPLAEALKVAEAAFPDAGDLRRWARTLNVERPGAEQVELGAWLLAGRASWEFLSNRLRLRLPPEVDLSERTQRAARDAAARETSAKV